MSNGKASKEDTEKFEVALKEFLQSQGYDDGLVVDWLLISAQHIIEDDGSSSTALALSGPTTQPIYRAAGLVKYANRVIDKRFVS